jgi:hypothetical protein
MVAHGRSPGRFSDPPDIKFAADMLNRLLISYASVTFLSKKQGVSSRRQNVLTASRDIRPRKPNV